MKNLNAKLSMFFPQYYEIFRTQIESAYTPDLAKEIVEDRTYFRNLSQKDFEILKSILLKAMLSKRHQSLQKISFEFPLEPLFISSMGNLQYLFESRGLKIADWSMNVLENTNTLSSLELRSADISILRLMIEGDNDLDKLVPKWFLQSRSLLENGLSLKPKEAMGICEPIKQKSLDKLGNEEKLPDYFLEKHLELSNKNLNHHFSELKKIGSLSDRLPTNPSNSTSCTQCHFNYLSNYTGPKFERSNNSYPLTFMYCANCHSDKENNVGGYIPFYSQDKFEKYIQSNPGYINKIEYRISDEALGNLDHMPPVILLNKRQKTTILKYLKSFN